MKKQHKVKHSKAFANHLMTGIFLSAALYCSDLSIQSIKKKAQVHLYNLF